MFFNEQRLRSWLTYGLALLPLTLLWYYEKSVYPFLTVKVFAFYTLVGAAAVLWLLLVLRHPQYRPRLTWLHASLLGLLVVLTIASAFGVNPLRSFWSVQERAVGVFGLWYLYVWFLMLTSVMRERREAVKTIVTWHFWISVAVAAFAVLQRISPELFFVESGGRPGGTLGNPSYLAAYLSITLFVGLWLARQAATRRAAVVLYAASAFEAAIIVLTETRGAILGLAVAAVGLLVWFAWQYWRGHAGSSRYVRNVPLMLLVAVVATGTVVFVTRDAPLWQKVPGLSRVVTLSLGEGTSLTRLIAWKASLDAATDHPILGYGFENFRYPFDARFDARLLRSGLADTYFDKPHNTPLEMLVSGGIPAFVLYLALAVLLAVRLSRSTHGALLVAGLAAYFVQNLFVFDTIGSYVAFFALAAIGEAAAPAIRKSERAHRLVTDRAAYALAILVAAGWVVSAYANGSVVYANLQHYRMLNSFANTIFTNALVHREAALAVFNPYAGSVHENFLTLVGSSVQNGILPEPTQFADLAMEGYKEAIRRDPTNYFLYINRADAASVLARLNHAYAADIGNDISRAEFLSPGRQQTYYVRAKYQLLKGDLAGAYAEIKKAVDLDPQAGDPHYYYGVLAFEQGDSETGLREFKTALDLGWYPGTASAAKTMAGRLGDAGDFESAYALFGTAYALQPADNDTLLKYALVTYYTQRFDEARELFKLLIQEKEFDDPNSRLNQELRPIFDQLGVIR